MTEDEQAYLEMFKPDTYAICFSNEIGRSLESQGLVEWVPPVWGNANNWRITPRGRAARRARKDKPNE